MSRKRAETIEKTSKMLKTCFFLGTISYTLRYITYYFFNGTRGRIFLPICPQFQETITRWLMIRFQKVWVFLISTRRDLSIALCFGSKNSNVYFFGSDENLKNKNFKKSKIFQIFIGTKKSIHLNFWSQNIAQSRDLVE